MKKNKIKWMALGIPVAIFWLEFWIAHLIGFKLGYESQWWAPPYLITSILLAFVSIFLTVVIIDRDYYEIITDHKSYRGGYIPPSMVFPKPPPPFTLKAPIAPVKPVMPPNIFLKEEKLKTSK